MRDLIIKLNKERGVSFIISSHLLDELGKIATRYGIINNGALVDEISSEELLDKCKKSLVIHSDNIAKAKEVLTKEKILDQYSESGNALTLFDHVEESAKINTLLVKAGINVSEIRINNSSIEDYFIERLGK